MQKTAMTVRNIISGDISLPISQIDAALNDALKPTDRLLKAIELAVRKGNLGVKQ